MVNKGVDIAVEIYIEGMNYKLSMECDNFTIPIKSH